MRSVKVERKAARQAARADRAQPARAARRELPAVQPGSARRGKDSGALRVWPARLSPVRPPSHAGAVRLALVLLVLLGALFVSGVIGRSLHARRTRRSTPSCADAGFGISEIHHHRQPPHPPDSHAGSAGHAAGPVHLQRRSVQRAQPADGAGLDRLGRSPSPLSRRHLRHAGREAALRAVAGAADAMAKRPSGWWSATAAHHHARTSEKFRRLPKLVGAGAPAAAADLVDAVRAASRHRRAHRRLCSASPSAAGT